MTFNRFPKKLLFLLIFIVLLSGSFYGGIKFEKSRNSKEAEDIVTQIIDKENSKPASIDFGIFWLALEKLEEKFVDQEKLQDKRRLVYGAVEGMVNSLGDPYTV